MNFIDDIIQIAIKEDIGTGDITTDNLIDSNSKGMGNVIAKEDFIVAGLDIAKKVFKSFDKNIEIDFKFFDGDKIKTNDLLMSAKGNIAALLKAERVALNFLQRLSGIATNANKFKNQIKNYNSLLVDTRKTIPGLRILEKYAIRVGGATNHRMGLYDGVLIKDNHIVACGSIAKAVKKIKKKVSHLIKIEVEVSSFEEIDEALKAGVDVIMLDNMNIKQMKKAVKKINKQALVEASGNIDINNLKEVAKTGVDIISSGALTHQASAVDISMRIIQNLCRSGGTGRHA